MAKCVGNCKRNRQNFVLAIFFTQLCKNICACKYFPRKPCLFGKIAKKNRKHCPVFFFDRIKIIVPNRPLFLPSAVQVG